jgi:hypothetical protein
VLRPVRDGRLMFGWVLGIVYEIFLNAFARGQVTGFHTSPASGSSGLA